MVNRERVRRDAADAALAEWQSFSERSCGCGLGRSLKLLNAKFESAELFISIAAPDVPIIARAKLRIACQTSNPTELHGNPFARVQIPQPPARRGHIAVYALSGVHIHIQRCREFRGYAGVIGAVRMY